MDSPIPPAQLPVDYESSERKRKRIPRVVPILLALIVFAILLGWQLGPFVERYRYRQLEQSCWQHASDPARTVFDEDPVRAAELLQKKEYVSGASSRSPSVQCALYDPQNWREVRQKRNFKYPSSAAVLFLHERKNSKGEARLIVVTKLCGPSRQPLVEPFVFKNGPNGIEEVVCGIKLSGPWIVLGSSLDDPSVQRPTIRFFEGTPDPTDDSHFSIGYEIAGHRGTIDGWLRGTTTDKVEFTLRDGPATRPQELPWVQQIMKDRDLPTRSE